MRAAVSSGVVLGVLACHEAVGPGPFSLSLQETRLPPSIQLGAALGDTVAFLVMHDTSAVPDTIYYGVCALAARMYDGDGFTHLAWQSVPSGVDVCAAVAVTVVVPAHDSVRIVAGRLAASPPGAPAPPSYGQVRSCINANGTLVELVAGVRDVIHAWTASDGSGGQPPASGRAP